MKPRKVPAGTEISFPLADGSIRTLRAETLEGDDNYHFITPTTPEDEAILRGQGYPNARKAAAEQDEEEEVDEDPDGPVSDTPEQQAAEQAARAEMEA